MTHTKNKNPFCGEVGNTDKDHRLQVGHSSQRTGGGRWAVDIDADAHLTLPFAKLVADLDGRCARCVWNILYFSGFVLKQEQYVVLKGRNEVVLLTMCDG